MGSVAAPRLPRWGWRRAPGLPPPAPREKPRLQRLGRGGRVGGGGRRLQSPALTLTPTFGPAGSQEAPRKPGPESGQRAASGTEGRGRAGRQQSASHGELGTSPWRRPKPAASLRPASATASGLEPHPGQSEPGERPITRSAQFTPKWQGAAWFLHNRHAGVCEGVRPALRAASPLRVGTRRSSCFRVSPALL